MGAKASGVGDPSTDMGAQASGVGDQPTDIEWMWQSNPDPWSKTQKPEWSHYSDVENVLIEKAFSANQSHAIMDGYCIDFKHRVQISDSDKKKQKPVKRVMCNKEERHLREERVMPDPIAPTRPFGGQYGWISPFIIEVRSSLNLERKQLPSTDENIVPMIVEKAALGIIEEGKLIGRRREGEELAEQLRAQRNRGIKEVWKCCALLYSLESFLYKKLNETMRLIGSEEQEEIWRNKIRTLGPFCLLFWDNPFNNKLNKNITLFRGAQLTPEQIATYEDLSTRPKEYRSFQAFTSCSRNRQFAENFDKTNVLFIMEVEYAFTVDLSPISKYPEEAEELVTPGVCFSVQRVEFDKPKKKHLIYLKLRQRFAQSNKKDLGTANTSNQRQGQSGLAARLAALDPNDLSDDNLSRILGDIDINNLTDADAVLLDDLLGFTAKPTRHGDINKEVRMVLLGATGNGKSSFGNTIIGNKKFKAKRSATSITQICTVEERKYKGEQLIVVDTPGFFDTGLPSDVIEDEIAKSYQILAPGPHVFLIVHNVCNRLTEEQRTAAKRVRAVFGEEAANFCVIVFTGIDELEDDDSTIEDYLGSLKPDDPLKELLNDYGRRYIAVNNKGTDAHKEKVLDELLRMVQKMVSQTTNGFYSTSKFEEVADIVGKSKAQGHAMVNPDGSIVLIPEVKKIVGAYLLANLRINLLND